MSLRKCSPRDRYLLAIAVVLICNVLFFYGLPVKVVFLLTAALAGLFAYIGGANALLASLSFAFGTLMFGGVLIVTKRDEAIYFRPQEIASVYDASLGHRRYKRKIRLETDVEHGDLLTISSKSPIEPETRHVVFQTDELGFRNRDDYHGQKIVLVGDSFIAGTGMTQSALLSETLLSDYEIDAYNLSHPGKMRDYRSYIRTFEKAYGGDFKVFLFFYEGNDFSEGNKRPEPWITDYPRLMALQRQFDAYHRKIKSTDLYRYTYSRRQKYIRKWTRKTSRGRKIPRVIVYEIGGMGVGFYKRGMDVTERNLIPVNRETEEVLLEVKDRISRIFFIPTKYRVYFKHIARSDRNGVEGRLPDRQWEYVQKLGKMAGVPVTDLTPALIAEADRLLGEGKLVYLRDDTHWNENGVRVAARLIAGMLGHPALPASAGPRSLEIEGGRTSGE